MNFFYKFRFLFSLLFVFTFVISCTTTDHTPEKMTKDDYLRATKHLSATMNPLVKNVLSRANWVDDQYMTYQKTTNDGTVYMIVDLKNGAKEPAFDHDKLAAGLSEFFDKEYTAGNLSLQGLSFKENGKVIEFSSGQKRIRCTLENYSFEEIDASPRPNRNEIVSPDGKLAAYINNYNLWVRNIENDNRIQLTFDGEEDFVYAKNNAGWIKGDGPVLKWSPDSKKIATFQQDARGLGEMYLTSTNVGHPRLEAWKHPLPGDEKVFLLERVVIHLGANPKVVRLKMEPDFQRSTTTDHIAGRGGELLDLDWNAQSDKLAFVSSSRDHKIAHLKTADIYTGAVNSVLIEEVETYFESGVRARNWRVFHDSNEVLWFSERDNWGHLYLYDLGTKELKHQITKGDWAVQQVRFIDEGAREIYFTAGGKEDGNPYHQYFYKVNFDGTNLVNLSPEKGSHTISGSPDWNYFIDSYSTLENPPVSVLKNRNGEKIMDLETADITALKANGWQQPIEFKVKARDHETDLYGIMYLPSHYDENKSYPVLNYIYPGPQSGSVRGFGFQVTSSDKQALAELGFVVMAVNAMGTPGRSKSFHDFYYGNMGDNGIPDNIATIKQLAETYKGMDLTRVGIWGHSGGGFASTGALFRYPDFYDVAVSGAGNHDNRNYEADWGEKWQGLLKSGKLEKADDGTTNYDNQANQLFAHQLKGKLLITHGSMDNNVPPSNTMLVVEALIKANKDFDFILFPNKRHGYGDMTDYMTRRRWDYFVKHLKNMEPPEEFSLDNF